MDDNVKLRICHFFTPWDEKDYAFFTEWGLFLEYIQVKCTYVTFSAFRYLSNS